MAEHEQTQQDVPEVSRRRDSTLRHWKSVHVLLERRSDLEGVVPMADLICEAVRWAA